MCVAYGDDARNVVFAFESLNLAEHLLFVLGNGVVDNGGERINVALSAPKSHLGLDQLNQTLDKQVLQKVRVGVSVISELLLHLNTSLFLKGFNEGVGLLHTLDSGLVHLLGPSNLEVTLCSLQVLLVLVLKSLLFGLDHLLRLHGEILVHLLLDLLDSFLAL